MAYILSLLGALALLVAAKLTGFYAPWIAPFLAATAATGYALRGPTGALLTAAAMAIGDLMLGVPGGFPVIWLLAFGMFLIGSTASKLSTFTAGSAAGIVSFWFITNSMVWYGSSMYPQNGAGWIASLVAGLPFLQAQLLGLAVVAGAMWASSTQSKRVTAV